METSFVNLLSVLNEIFLKFLFQMYLPVLLQG